MALDDLASVTQTLILLLQHGIGQSNAWGGADPTVSPLPPDLMGSTNDLGLYLYHIAEDAHFRNPPPAGVAPGANATRPLALNLYYQLTAQVGSDAAGAWRAQLLMSCALRVLHDYAVITDATTMAGTTESSDFVLDWRSLRSRQNRLRVTLRPVPADDAVDYWTAGQAPLRLAAYYQVSVVLLEPEPVPSVTSPVLNYGSTVFASGAPTLTSSRARLPVVVGTDTDATEITVQPAQVALGTSSLPGSFELHGSALSAQGTELRLRNQRGTYTVDSASWAVVATADKVFATVGEWVDTVRAAPGVWSASVVVRKGAGASAVRHPSNETPIVLTPRLDAVSATGPTLGTASLGSVTTVNGWLFRDDLGSGDDSVVPAFTTDPEAVKLYVGANTLTRVADGGAPAAGEFSVMSETRIDLRLPATEQPGAVVPVRVSVNGAVSAPRWLGVTA